MVSTRSPCCRILLLLVFVECVLSSATAQLLGEGTDPIATATIPASNEALILSTKVEEALGVGDYRLAAELIDQLRGAPAGLVAAPAGRTYYPVWRQAFRLLQQFPPDAAALYRRLHDAEVVARFQQAAEASDQSVLRELFYTYRLSSAWTRIGEELAAQLIERGAYGDAVEILRDLLKADLGAVPEHQAMMVIALGGAGAVHSAKALLSEMRAAESPADQPFWEDRLAAIEDWLNSSPAGDEEQGREFSPCIEAGAVWAHEFDQTDAVRAREESRNLADAVATLRRTPFQNLTAVDDSLLFRRDGYLYAFDARTLTPRWMAPTRARTSDSSPEAAGAEASDGVALSGRARMLINSHLRNAVSAAFGKAYTVEWASWYDSGLSSLSRLSFPPPREGGSWNELVARNLDDGSIAWSSREDSLHPLFDVMFQNTPVAVGDRLIAPFARNDALLLAELDPATGDLLSETLLVGPPTEFSSAEVRVRGGRCLIAGDATTLYVGTGHGVVAALSKDGLEWKWAAAYPSTLAERIGRLWWMPVENPTEPNIDPPLLADDLLIMAPVDTHDIFALDRFDGSERWRMPRGQLPYLMGVLRLGGGSGGGSGVGAETRLIVGGREVHCLDLYDPLGKPPLWRSAPLQITGRALIRGDYVYVPTDEGIIVLDGYTGKIVRDQHAGARPSSRNADAAAASERLPVELSLTTTDYETAQNLFATRDSLYGLSLNRLTKYPDPVLLLEHSRVEAGQPASDEAAIETAWSHALEGRFKDALACMPENLEHDSKLSAARDQVLTFVFMQLAREAAPGGERLDWLERASSLAATPEASVRMAATIGRVLEKAERWDEALRHYGGQLYGDAEALIQGGERRTVAAWLYAAERIAALHNRGRSDLEGELIAEALADGDVTRNLQRLRIALYDRPVRERIEQMLCMRDVPPEIKAGYLTAEIDSTAPEAVQRRLCLERWDVHVSLGRLDLAARDRELWTERFAALEAPETAPEWAGAYVPLGADEITDRVDAIDLATRKQADAWGDAFVPPLTRQWKIEQAELLLDELRAWEITRPWILTVNFESRRIELIQSFKHQYPQRQTPDAIALMDGRSSVEDGRSELKRLSAWQGGLLPAWPAITYDQLAAVPVRGGLVGVGMGPERYAGRRLWEYRMLEWNAIPRDVPRTSVAGPHGVYIAARRDRVDLIGWEDGRLRWEREFPGMTIERLGLAAEQLVLITEDKQVWLVDAMFGAAPRRIEFGDLSPSRVDLVGDTIVAWGADAVAAVECRGLTEVWRRTVGPVGAVAVVPNKPWIAYRSEPVREWRLIDVRDGRPVMETPLGRFDALSAIAADDERIYAAGRSARPEDEGEQLRLSLRAFALADGEQLWRHEFVTGGVIDVTQLIGHPDYIPVLLSGPEGDTAGETERPAIQLIDKRQGGMLEPFSIAGDYRAFPEASCEMRMLVTPSRIIVQAGGNIIGYGNSPLRTKP